MATVNTLISAWPFLPVRATPGIVIEHISPRVRSLTQLAPAQEFFRVVTMHSTISCEMELLVETFPRASTSAGTLALVPSSAARMGHDQRDALDRGSADDMKHLSRILFP
jgi:hypothetical protein